MYIYRGGYMYIHVQVMNILVGCGWFSTLGSGLKTLRPQL